LPRLRIDQLMSFCWKGLIPATLANIVVTAVLLLAFPGTLLPVAAANWAMLGVFLAAIPWAQRRRLTATRKRLRVDVRRAAPETI